MLVIGYWAHLNNLELSSHLKILSHVLFIEYNLCSGLHPQANHFGVWVSPSQGLAMVELGLIRYLPPNSALFSTHPAF